MTQPAAPPPADEFCQIQQVAIYRHYDAAGELLYIGITANPDRRWTQHLESSLWARFVARVDVRWLADRPTAEAVERRAIRAEQPIFNLARAGRTQAVNDRVISYIRRGASGLPRRVPCRSVPGEFCISCGPDRGVLFQIPQEASC